MAIIYNRCRYGRYGYTQCENLQEAVECALEDHNSDRAAFVDIVENGKTIFNDIIEVVRFEEKKGYIELTGKSLELITLYRIACTLRDASKYGSEERETYDLIVDKLKNLLEMIQDENIYWTIEHTQTVRDNLAVRTLSKKHSPIEAQILDFFVAGLNRVMAHISHKYVERD